jgi:predicted nuclease of predicted toxin-antitoxin system
MAKVKFYLDENIALQSLARELDRRGVEVIRAVDVGMEGKDDTEHLSYAAAQKAVLVTRDRPFARRTMERTDHAGLICWTGRDNDIGGMVQHLTRFSEDYDAELVVGEVFWIP